MAEPRSLARVAVILLTTCSLLFHRSSSGPAPAPAQATTLCIPRERDTLLDFRADLTDPGNLLSSWQGADCCRWKGVKCSNRTGDVVTLHVNGSAYSQDLIGGEIHSSLLTLRHLHLLDLSLNDFSGKPIPDFIGALRSLTHLDLSDSNFGGRIPPHIGNLSNLISLQITNVPRTSQLISHDLAWVSRLQKLELLDLSGVDLSAAVDWAHALNMLPSLTKVYLTLCGLRNTMPPPVHSNLTSLKFITMDSNLFNESIGARNFDWNLPSLKQLSIKNCGFYGSIPDAMGNLTSLQDLDLDGNHITGTDTIPMTFKKLKNLKVLSLRDNFINMSVADLLDRLPSDELEWLYLDNNNLTGCLPSRLGHFSSLRCIDLGNNKIFGEIPVGLRDLTKLLGISLRSNNLHGTITEQHFPFGGQLEVLDISSNQLVGPIPMTFPPSLTSLDLSKNNLSGTLPSKIEKSMLQAPTLFSNSFSGTIPCSLLQLQHLRFLDLSKNQLSGTLPNCPQQYETSNIILLNLNNNNFFGEFPIFLQSCRELISLDLAYNKFSGSLPTWIQSKLPQLALLRLRSNKFSGAIPDRLTRMKGLQYLDIACNNISGNIPQSIGNLTAMTLTPNNSGSLSQVVNFYTETMFGGDTTYIDGLLVDIKGQQLEYTSGIIYMVSIDLSCNSLTGQIPQEIGMLVALKNLNLSGNSLSDRIPKSIGELRQLESFDLSHNRLGSEIPADLSALSLLARLNLSYNNLTGTIPSGNQLRTLDDQASIYIGNRGLCGPPLTRNCSGTDITPLAPGEHEGMHDVVSFYLGMCIGFVVGLWIVFCGFLFKRKWRVKCFLFSDHMYDWFYMQVIVGRTSLARKFCGGRGYT